MINTSKIIDWLGRMFKPPREGLYDVGTYREEAIEEQAALDAFALFSVVHLIAGLLSGCEFRVFRRGTELHGAEWAALNVKPSRNQNAAAWKRELIARLLLSGEVLCIELPDHQRLIAESFNKTEDAIKGDIFTDVQRADATINRQYRITDVFYLQSPVNARAVWLQNCLMMYEHLMTSAAKRFRKAGGEKGILKVSAIAQGKQGFEERFDKMQNEYFKNYFNNSNAVLPLFDGYEFIPQNSSGGSGTYTNDLSSIKTLADEAISRAAQVFGVPPSYMRGDAAGIRDAQGALLTNCVKPLAEMISEELTGKLYTIGEIADGCKITVDTGSILHHDLISDSDGIDKLIGAGFTLNEVFAALGQPKSEEAGCNTRFITKNYGTLADAMEGGEENAE